MVGACWPAGRLWTIQPPKRDDHPDVVFPDRGTGAADLAEGCRRTDRENGRYQMQAGQAVRSSWNVLQTTDRPATKRTEPRIMQADRVKTQAK